MERCQKYWYGGKIIEKDDEIRVERRYYITSLQTDATLFAKAVFCASRKCREMQRKVQRLALPFKSRF